MQRSTSSLAVLALSALAAVTGATEPTRTETHPILGEALVINGEAVSFDEVKRQIVLGPLGVENLRLARLSVFIDQEIKRQVDAGADPAKFQVEKEDVDEAIANAEKQIDELYEGQDLNLPDLYPTQDKAWLDNVTLTQRFNKVFFPDNPNDYPAMTVAALEEGANGGTSLYQHILNDWQMRQDDPSIDPDPVGKAMLAMITNQTVIKYLEKSAEIVNDPDELPQGVAMIVDGVQLKIDDLWEVMKARVTPTEVETAKRWIVNMKLIEQNLKDSGHWIDDQTLEERYNAYTEPYKDSPFNIETIALRFQKFPTVDAYKDYYRITESMRGRIRSDMRNTVERKNGEDIAKEAADKAKRLVSEGNETPVDQLTKELQEEILQDYVDQRWDEQLVRTSATRTSKLAGDARVQVDVILLSAYDFARKRWIENGWEEAEKRTKALMTQLENGLSWKDAVEQFSDFYDAPVPTNQTSELTLNNKGRFRAIARNDLMKRLEESAFSAFVYGESLTDAIFFDIPVGDIQAPVRGPYGYYVVKLFSRGGPKRMLDIENPDHRELIEQDFVATRLERFVRTLVENNEILGIRG